MLKLAAGWVESVSLSVYFVPLLVTEETMWSPGRTALLTAWMVLLGNISHHEK